MWDIDNRTPFAGDGAFKRDQAGAEVWVVIIKTSFDIMPDSTTKISQDQLEPLHAPVYNFEPGVSSMKYDTDFVLDKEATDVILNGQAWSKKGMVTRVEPAIQVGSINKKLIVTGERTWRNDLLNTKSLAMPFKSMPLVYERAYGGIDITCKDEKKHVPYPANPAGTGFSIKSSCMQNKKVPNIKYKSGIFANKKNPAGFGAISCHWQPRASYGGTYDEKWEQEQKPLLPKDFNMKYFQHAPEDQQIKGYLKGGEPVILKNLHPRGDLSFNLPKTGFECITELDSKEIEHKPNLHTVIFEPDDNKVIMVWHTAVQCHKKEHLLEKTIIRQIKT